MADQEKVPASQKVKRVGIGAAVGVGASGATSLALRKKKIPGWTKNAITGVASAGTGLASIPIQGKIMQRSSHGKYTVTPTGVTRVKSRPVPASAKANRVEYQGGQEVPARLNKSLYSTVPAAQAKQLLRNRMTRDATAKAFYRDIKAGRRTSTGHLVSTTTVVKADTYPGANMTHGQKRARVMSAGTTPVIGDIAAAKVAGHLAPPNLKHKTEALQAGGSIGGGVTGGVLGAYGGAGLVKQVPAVRRHAERINSGIDSHVRDPIAHAQEKMAGKIHPKFGDWVKARHAKQGTAMGRRFASVAASKHPGMAAVGRFAVRAHKPLVGAGAAATLGAMVGQSTGSTLGSTTAYGHALNLEDKQRGYKIHKSTDNRHGSRISKLAPSPGMSRREELDTAHKKRQSAALSATSGTAGLTALSAGGVLLAGGKRLKLKHPRLHRGLVGTNITGLTLSSGVSGLNAFKYSGIQRKEAKELAAKAFRMPRIPLRAPVKASGPRQGGLVRTGGVVRTRRGSI